MTAFESSKSMDGGDIFLRPFVEADLELLTDWLADSEVTAFLELGRLPPTQENLREFLDLENKNSKSVAFSISESSSKTVIGYCGLFLIDWISRRAQLNIMIGERRFWDKGYGSRSCILLLEYAFYHLNLNSVQLGVHAENLRAIKSYKNVGFVLEGSRREFIYCNGKYSDLQVFSVLKSEYQK